MCAAYYAANNATNDKDDNDNDGCNPPSRAIPRHLCDGGLGTIPKLPWLLVRRYAIWRCMGVRAAILVSNGERGERGSGEEVKWRGGRGRRAQIANPKKGRGWRMGLHATCFSGPGIPDKRERS
jgi:hypothetical protein